MTTPAGMHLLTLNVGSSSIKAAVYDLALPEQWRVRMTADQIGLEVGMVRLVTADGTTATEEHTPLPDHTAAFGRLLDKLHRQDPNLAIGAVGHRVVHGGPASSAPQLVTPALLAALRALVPLAPNHLPPALAAIEAVGRAYPGRLQVACFDTAFHRAMPRVARLYALPRALTDAGIIRYGFHGLSYEYILSDLRRIGEPAATTGRLIIAHLGSGASLAAVHDGRSIDTTMGFTPTSGLVMGTRVGDLDPGVVLFLLRAGRSVDAVEQVLTEESGLLGVSGSSADMAALLERAADDLRAAEAIDLFCYQARKQIGSLAAALGGLDALVFTGGIGEHAPSIRARICAGLEFLGLALDPDRNAAGRPVVSASSSPVIVRVMSTDEDLMIARHTATFAARPPMGAPASAA